MVANLTFSGFACFPKMQKHFPWTVLHASGKFWGFSARLLAIYWSGSLENHKATKPAFNIWPSLARQKKGWPTSSVI